MRALRGVVSRELAGRIEEWVETAGLRPHDRLPAERELCRRWRCNRVTLRSALATLTAEGRLYRVAGRGTYVAAEKIRRDLYRFCSFTEAMARAGHSVSTVSLEQRVVDASRGVAQALRVAVGEPLVFSRRLRHVGNSPLALEESYVPHRLCPGLFRHDLETHSLFDVLASRYHVVPVRGTEDIEIRHATAGQAAVLGVRRGAPILLLSGVAFDASDQPVEYCQAWTRGDRCVFSSLLQAEARR